MKQICRAISLFSVVVPGWFAPAIALAQAQPVFLTWKGAGVGSNLSPGTVATDIQVTGGYAYLAWLHSSDTNHPGGLEVFSITNSLGPVRVGSYETRSAVNAVWLVGNYAYLAVGTARTLTNDVGALEIVNVSDPASPVRVGEIGTLGKANGIKVVGNYAYVPESTRWTGTNLLGALELFNVSTATQPIRVGAYDTTGSATAVDVSGNYAYLADGMTDLRVLDVSQPSTPISIGVYDIDEHLAYGAEFGGPATYIQKMNNVVYSAGENGLHLLDVSTPSNPVRIGGDGSLPFAYAFHVAANRVFAVFWSSLRNAFILTIFDATTNLTAVGGTALLGSPSAISVAGDRLYSATVPVYVYEMSDRPSITSLSSTNGTLSLTWNSGSGFVLQRAASLNNPVWIEVPDSVGVSKIELPVTNGSEFFRLATP
jgi:hypothetical protein